MWRASCCWIQCILISILSLTAAAQSLCDKVDDEGVLRVKPKQWERLDEVCECTHLIQLELKKLPLLKLPPCLANLQEIRSLDLTKTGLVTFPKVVLEMYSLEHLSIAHTGISFLPDEIADLPNLKTLDLRGTGVEVLPHGLEYLEMIDMRLIMISKAEQDTLRAQFPNTDIFLSSPCHCH